MKKTDMREQMLLDALKAQGRIETEEAINLLNVSESTLRRTFINLEEKGLIIRTLGGAQLVQESPFAYSFEKLSIQNIEKKAKIGIMAAELIDSDDVVYIDCGTTTARICAAFAQRLHHTQLKNVTIFTNSLVNLNILSPACKVSLIGGEYRPHRQDFCGFLAENALKLLSFNKCFLGADGFASPDSFTTTDFSSASLNQIVLQRSQEKNMVVDSMKFLKSSFVTYVKAKELTNLITDSDMPIEAMAAFVSHRVNILQAE